MTTVAVFGPGSMYVTRNDIANQTPINIGFVQEFSYDEAGETKELFGENQYPLVIARGTIKATGKARAAMVSGIALNAVWHAGTLAAGQLLMDRAYAVTAIPTTPFEITITPPSSGTFNTDLGVVNAATGLPFALVPSASTPTAGQYKVDPATGKYTFSSADNVSGISVKIVYAYTVSGTGQHITVANTPIGSTPSFQIDFASSLYNKPYYVRMFNAVSTKLTRAHKLVDFMMPEIDFGFFTNAAGNVYEESYPEVS